MAFSSPGMNFAAFRSLSRAMLRGYLRDRTALAFSILLPVLFLALLGSLYRSSATPKLSVVEIGSGSLLGNTTGQPGLSGVLTVTHSSDKQAAVREVRRGAPGEGEVVQRGEDHRGVPLARRRRLDGAQRLVGLTQGDGDALVQRRCFGGVDLTEVPVHLSECAGPTHALRRFLAVGLASRRF